MSPSAGSRFAFMFAVIVFAGGSFAQENEPAKAKPRKPAAGRLPAHYADIVSPDQKAKIYAAQAKWKEKLDPLTEEIKKIQAERDAEIETLLSPEQREKLAKAKAEAAAKRAAAIAAAKKAPVETAKPAEPEKKVEATPVAPAKPAEARPVTAVAKPATTATPATK